MTSIAEFAKAYEPPKTKNIVDLKEVDTKIQIETKTAKDEKNGDEFSYFAVVVDNQEYRIPASVIGSLKAIMEKKPDLKKFSVTKTGSGLNTRYSVIPIE